VSVAASSRTAQNHSNSRTHIISNDTGVSVADGTELISEASLETALYTARRQLNKVACSLDVDEHIVERLNYPEAVHEVTHIMTAHEDTAMQRSRWTYP
jgi:hypothetical protein